MRRAISRILIGAVVIVVAMVGWTALRGDGITVNLVWDGDSQSAPVADLIVPAEVAAKEVGAQSVVRALATPGATLDLIASRAAGTDALLADANHHRNVFVLWAGTNDLGLGEDASATVAELAAYANARRQAGWTVMVLTALPRSFAGDVPGYEERRLAFNGQVRRGWRGYADHLVDVASLPGIGNNGDQVSPDYYAADHTHLNDRGRQRVGTAVGQILATL